LTAANSIVPALFRAITTILDAVALTVPNVDPLEITKLAGVPVTVVTVPLLKVVERKSNVNADAVIVNALDATEAEMGWIWGLDTMLLVNAIVPVASGNVNVRFVAVVGAAIFRTPAPLALPEICTELMGSP